MPLFKKLREPVFLKDTSSEKIKLEQLHAADRSHLPEELARQLDDDIRIAEYGIKEMRVYGKQPHSI